MQCLQASESNLSVLERQRACYSMERQQMSMINNGYNGTESFVQAPCSVSTPFRVIDNGSHGDRSGSEGSFYVSVDNNCYSNGWPHLGNIQYNDVGVGGSDNKVTVQEETSMNLSCSNLKKRKSENFNNSKKEVSRHGIEDGGDKKLKEESSEAKQSKSKKEVSGDTATENSKQPKTDYIHVRARRGQATDSHSLAERVRRERISERMKYLQELVPGCNKITGKAGMLDEIINYVQSLQRQVEFLSMKLATVNPSIDFNLENFLNAEINPGCISNSIPVTDISSLEQLEQSFLHFNSFQQTNTCPGSEAIMNAREMALRKTLSTPITVPQVQGSIWDTNLQNLYGVEFNQGKLPIQLLQGSHILNHLKMEM